MADPFTWGALITSAVGAKVARNRMPDAPQKSPAEIKNQQQIEKDRFEKEADRNKALIRSMRGNQAYGSQFSLLNPQNIQGASSQNQKLGN